MGGGGAAVYLHWITQSIQRNDSKVSNDDALLKSRCLSVECDYNDDGENNASVDYKNVKAVNKIC